MTPPHTKHPMRPLLLAASLITGSLLMPGFASAQALPAGAGPAAESPNRFGLSYRMGFNMKVHFENLGGFQPATMPAGPDAGAYADRVYDDGYNRVDNNGNTYLGYPPVTRNWGYYYGNDGVHPNQVSGNPPSGPTFILLHSASSPTTTASDDQDNTPLHGLELTYNRELGRNEHWRWGLESAFGYTGLSIRDRRALMTEATRIEDSFEVPPDTLTGLRLIPPTPYYGSDAPGPLLGSQPTRTTTLVPGRALITGDRRFDADLFGFRLGPYLEYPLSDNVKLGLSSGFALAYVNSDFTFNETVTIPGTGTLTRSGSGAHDSWRPGFYLSSICSLALSESWSLFAGAQFQYLGTYTHSETAKRAVLDLRHAIFVNLGFSYSF